MLGALFYPKGTKDKPIPFDSLYIPYIYNEIYFDGVYLDVVNMLEHTKKDPVLLDIGANIGIVTQHLRNYGKVYAVEPSSEHFEALKKNKEFNEWDNVEIFNYAISDKDGTTTLNRNKTNLTMNSIAVEYLPYAKGDSTEVETKTFTSFLKDAGITHVDFAKIDIEGSEDLVIPSPEFAEAVKMIDCMEIAFHRNDFPKHLQTMRDIGFKDARRYSCSEILFLFTK